jgi:hypothetical protein
MRKSAITVDRMRIVFQGSGTGSTPVRERTLISKKAARKRINKLPVRVVLVPQFKKPIKMRAINIVEMFLVERFMITTPFGWRDREALPDVLYVG